MAIWLPPCLRSAKVEMSSRQKQYVNGIIRRCRTRLARRCHIHRPDLSVPDLSALHQVHGWILKTGRLVQTEVGVLEVRRVERRPASGQ